MPAHKRTRSGQPKPQNMLQDPDIAMTNATPPCAQPLPSTTSTDTPPPTTTTTTHPASSNPLQNPPNPHQHAPTRSNRAANPPKRNRPPHPPPPHHHKMRKLPPTATLSKRPLLHPALPSPFASAASPKIIYLSASTPYIPCVKRVRSLLAAIRQRATQASGSAARGPRGGYAAASGRLEAGAVEREIAAGVGEGGGKGGERVVLKATGRAIGRALEVGVLFQGEGLGVRVEMGSVRAVDDVEGGGGGEEEDGSETRIRTLSSVTVSIGVR